MQKNCPKWHPPGSGNQRLEQLQVKKVKKNQGRPNTTAKLKKTLGIYMLGPTAARMRAASNKIQPISRLFGFRQQNCYPTGHPTRY
jgi:hypothetical protein